MKTLIMLAVGLLCITAGANAQQSTKNDDFWNKLQSKLEKIVPAKKTATTTAVGGVRGAKNDDADDIYWKGKEKPADVEEKEYQKFNVAVENKIKGNNELALQQFEEFLTQYPQSSLRLDGLQAVELLKAETAAAKSPGKTD